MTRTVRSRGPRRRGDQRTLVRPMPVFNTPPPPIPLGGQIRRLMTPSFIADYEGLATASWTAGVTGNIGTAASSSWNCQYHHVVRTNPRVEYNVILPPVRWQIAAPSSNGGTYDFWNTRTGGRAGYIPQGSVGGGTIGISDKLLPSGHFAEYPNGFAELLEFPFPPGCRRSTTAVNVWLESALQAISPGTEISATGPTISIAAIRHRVNGTAVGSLTLDPPGSRWATTAWRFDLVEGDSYAIDIWYRFRIFAQQLFQPTKACAYIPTTRVSNGSRRVLPTILFAPVAVFQNINYSPAFNFAEQTYSVTVSGHSGWTLKDGSDGPHKMISSGSWSAGIGNGEIVWKFVPANGYCDAIVFRWNREQPHVEFYPGPLHSSWGGSASATSPLIFRPAAAGYRTSTTSTDFSTLGHIDAGTINQAGSTTYNLVQSITDARANIISGSYFEPEFPEAFEFGAGVGILNEDVPTSITLTRVNQ